MAIIYRPGVFTIVQSIKFLCRFINKHEGSARAVFVTVLTPAQMDVYDACVLAIQALCAVFNAVYPTIKP